MITSFNGFRFNSFLFWFTDWAPFTVSFEITKTWIVSYIVENLSPLLYLLYYNKIGQFYFCCKQVIIAVCLFMKVQICILKLETPHSALVWGAIWFQNFHLDFPKAKVGNFIIEFKWDFSHYYCSVIMIH